MHLSPFALAFALGARVSSAAYSWSNVHIGGGGGFIPGIVFNPTTKGVAYARADIGGLYRLNSDDSWTPLTDSITMSTSWHNWGTDAVATDPVNSKNVYAAVGMYTNSWDPNNGAIIRSTDMGNTWAFSNLTFKVGGNMPGRGMGERLAVDPQNNKIIYFGARSGNGLWKSVDQGVTFTKVTSFTAVGTYEADPTDTTGYQNDLQGLAFVTFDSTSGTTNGATSRIFVGTADKTDASVYVSNDAGATWSAVAGQPIGNLPHKCKLQPEQKVLYLTYSNTSGPYDGGTGSVNMYNITSGVWTDITPVSGSNLYFGFGGLGVDMLKPGTLVVASLNSWYPDLQLFRSTDSGSTWSPIWAWTSYPSEDFYYSYNTAKAPWIEASRLSTDTKQLGWMVEALEIDPFDSNHMLYGTGLTLYGTHDLTDWDTTHNISITSLADGIEEESVQEVVSVQGGSELLVAVGDDGGFTFKTEASLGTSPSVEWLNPELTTNTGVDYAGNTPADIVRVGNTDDGTQQIAVSTDGGATWNIDYGWTAGLLGGRVAYSANADTVLWSTTSSGVVVSQYTNPFTSVSTLPSGAAIASDKRNGTVFYGGSGGSFYISIDTGKTFTKTATLGSAASVNDIAVNPTLSGDIWVSTDVGVFHSTSYGASFTQPSTAVTGTYQIALGKGSGSYYNVYVFGTGASGDVLYASGDSGVTWTDIQGTQGMGAISSNALAGSFDTAGLVFVGTNGRGVFQGSGSVAAGSGTSTSSMASSTSKTSSVASSTSKTSSVASSTSKASTTVSSTTSKATTTSSSVKVTTTSTTLITSKTTSATTTTSSAAGTVPKYGQCGGTGWTGGTVCVAGSTCTYSNLYYSQCL